MTNTVFALVIFIGFYVKGQTNTSKQFFLAGREMTAWIAGLSFVSANLGSLELMGWAGAAYPAEVVKHEARNHTAASSGVGWQAARLFACQRSHIVVTARRKERLKRLTEEIQPIGGEAVCVAGDAPAMELNSLGDDSRHSRFIRRHFGVVTLPIR